MGKLLIVAIITSIFLFHDVDMNAQNRPVKKGRSNNKVVVVKRGHHKNFHRKNVVIVRKRQGRTVAVLPNGYATCVYRKNNYYFHDGFFYRNYDNSYHVIAAPIGIKIRALPIGCRQIIMRGQPHFFYRGAFYKSVGNEYEAVAPEVGTVVPEIPDEIAEQIEVEGITYYEIEDYLYKPVETPEGRQYEVAGELDDSTND
jgi:hypothetical protein